LSQTLNFNGTLLSTSSPVVMGIINLTGDSFYVPSRTADVDQAVEKAGIMLRQGASILDIGAMSSRPGAQISKPADEIAVLKPAIAAIKQQFPDAIISVDTIHAAVAEEVLQAGASAINDISAGTYDQKMLSVVSEFQAPYFMMHMKGLPSDMQLNPLYNDVVDEVLKFFVERIRQARNAGIRDIVIDPGFGFGKNMEHNFRLMKHLHVFSMFELPVLVGISRKSMIWKHLGIQPEQALNGTTALHMFTLVNGARILRVHDVAEAIECIRLYNTLDQY
jgi:dihydropteroate synthase